MRSSTVASAHSPRVRPQSAFYGSYVNTLLSPREAHIGNACLEARLTDTRSHHFFDGISRQEIDPAFVQPTRNNQVRG
jgi:hypothetical protein